MNAAKAAAINKRVAFTERILANFPADLIQLPQWVNWKLETRGKRTTKVPYQSNGLKAESTNSATWSDFQTVKNAFLKDAKFTGIGFVFTKDDPYVGIDLDKCRDPATGAVEPWAAEILARFSAYTELSPSGKGFHIIGKGQLPPEGRRKDRIEMYESGRYFTVTGDHYGHSPNVAADIQAPLLAFHAEVFGKTSKRTKKQKAANEPLLGYKLAPQPTEDQAVIDAILVTSDAETFKQFQSGNWEALGYPSQSEGDLAFAGMLARHAGHHAGQIDRLFRRSAMMRDKWDEKRGVNTYGELTIAKVLEGSESSTDPFIERMNQRYAVIAIGNQIKILDARDGAGSKLLSRPDFALQTANLPSPKNGASAATLWLQSPQRLSYNGLVFAPARDVVDHFNLWRGFSVQPHPGDCSLFWALVHGGICAGSQELYDYVRCYYAHLVQRPWERPEVALVLRGGQGTGKNTFVDTIGSLVPHHFRQVNSTDQLTGRFNGHLKGVLLLHANEASWGGNKSERGKLKAMITDAKVPIELKGQDIVDIDNYLRLVVSSNEDWPVPIDIDDRRFLVLDVSPMYKQDQTFFASLHAQLANGGREALMHDLTVEDISRFSPRNKPISPFGADIKIRSADTPTRWLYDLLNGNAWTGGSSIFAQVSVCAEVSKEGFYTEYQQWGRASSDRYPVARDQFFKTIRHLLGSSITESRPAAGPGQARERKFILSSIEACRIAFETATGTCGGIAWESF